VTTNDPHERRPWHTDEEWTRLHARLTTADADSRLAVAGSTRAIWQWSALAAAVVIAAVGVSMARRARPASSPTPAVRVMATKPGERRTIRLDDSSTIALAPATRVRISGDSTRREIDLDGMADFTVRHDRRRVFVVRAGDAVTTDIGTQFVIRAYASDASVSVAVTDGSVLVRSRRDILGHPHVRRSRSSPRRFDHEALDIDRTALRHVDRRPALLRQRPALDRCRGPRALVRRRAPRTQVTRRSPCFSDL